MRELTKITILWADFRRFYVPETFLKKSSISKKAQLSKYKSLDF